MPGTGPGASCHWFSPLRGLRGRHWPSPVSGQDTHRGPERLDPLLKCQGCRSAIPAPRTPKPPLPAAGPALAGSRLGRPRQALSLLHLNRWQRHPPAAGEEGRVPGSGQTATALRLCSRPPSPRTVREGRCPAPSALMGGRRGSSREEGDEGLRGKLRKSSPPTSLAAPWAGGAPPRLPEDSAGCQEAAVLQSLTLGAL